MTMPRPMLIPVLLTCLATGVQAQSEPVCDFTGPTLFPELEEAKAAFLAGDYDGFFALSAAQMPTVDGTELMAGITQAVPDGFTGCTTVVQREDAGGFVQEVTVFQLPDDKGMIGLYLQSALIDGERAILQFTFNSTLDETLEKLR
jgi:hypothetical protein